MNVLSRRQAEEHCAKRVLVQAILHEVKRGYFSLKLILLHLALIWFFLFPVGGLAQSWMQLNAEEASQCEYIFEEAAHGLEWLEVDLVGFDFLVVLEIPNVLHC